MVLSTTNNDDREQWVAFEESGSFRGGSRQRKRGKSARSAATNKAGFTGASGAMNKTTLAVDPAISSLPPPGTTVAGLRRHSSKKKPVSPRVFLQPVNPAPHRQDLQKIKALGLDPAKHDSSTSSSSGSEEQQRERITTSKTTKKKNGGSKRKPPKSASNNNRAATSSRGRSTSRSLPNTPTGTSSRARSTSRSSNGRGRSTSRSRPPPTRNNNIRKNRSRSRSASLTRVTGPNTTSSSSRSSNTSNRPPPTSRTLEEMRTKGRGRSNSVGPGVTPRSHNSDEFSSDAMRNHDDNIGRDISFGPNVSISTLGCSFKNEHKSNSKRPGIMEKLFGDQVEKPPAHIGIAGGCLNYEIRPRILLAATVYHNTATNLWITTINTNQRGVARDPTTANRYLKAFSFSTEREARESAIANAPPKMMPFDECPSCFICNGKFAVFRRASHCRNCGTCVCSTCSTSWPSKMIPDTYNLKKEANVKICLSCNSLSTAFKNALNDGNYEEAVALYGTGNVNLRTPFPVSSKKDEVMYPIHCAVEGGNIDILRWLIDDHFCPIKLVRTGTGKRAGEDVPILTSKGRSLLSIAIDRVKVDIMRYLVVECGVSIYESTDLKASLRALEAALIALPQSFGDRSAPRDELPVSTRWDTASFDEISEPSSLGVDEPLIVDDRVSVGSRRSSWTKGSSRNGETCIICFENKIDCCATPCGHQICCLKCSSNLSACPVCNTRGKFIKIFRP